MTGFILSPGERDLQRIVYALTQLLEGRSTAVGSITLTINVASTIVTAVNCGPDSAVFLFPQTADAAAAVATTYVGTADVKRGSFTIHHANNAQADRSFWFVCLG